MKFELPRLNSSIDFITKQRSLIKPKQDLSAKSKQDLSANYHCTPKLNINARKSQSSALKQKELTETKVFLNKVNTPLIKNRKRKAYFINDYKKFMLSPVIAKDNNASIQFTNNNSLNLLNQDKEAKDCQIEKQFVKINKSRPTLNNNSFNLKVRERSSNLLQALISPYTHQNSSIKSGCNKLHGNSKVPIFKPLQQSMDKLTEELSLSREIDKKNRKSEIGTFYPNISTVNSRNQSKQKSQLDHYYSLVRCKQNNKKLRMGSSRSSLKTDLNLGTPQPSKGPKKNLDKKVLNQANQIFARKKIEDNEFSSNANKNLLRNKIRKVNEDLENNKNTKTIHKAFKPKFKQNFIKVFEKFKNESQIDNQENSNINPNTFFTKKCTFANFLRNNHSSKEKNGIQVGETKIDYNSLNSLVINQFESGEILDNQNNVIPDKQKNYHYFIKKYMQFNESSFL